MFLKLFADSSPDAGDPVKKRSGIREIEFS
jgi:hypothetical protein